MADVVEFKSKRPAKVWECVCGCQEFYLHETGEVERRKCKLISGSITVVLVDENA